MTRKEVLASIANDCVIIRNDGVVIRNKLGDYRIFASIDGDEIKKELKELKNLTNKVGGSYTFTAIRYNDLPEDKKYNP